MASGVKTNSSIKNREVISEVIELKKERLYLIESLQKAKASSELSGREIVRIRKSIKYQLGHHIVNATSFKGFIRLPLALYRVYKQHLRRKDAKRKALKEKERLNKELLRHQQIEAEKQKVKESLRLKNLLEDKRRVGELIKLFRSKKTAGCKVLKVAGIMDEFTFYSYNPECNLLQLSPEDVEEQLESFLPDFVFIESAWKGKDGLWQTKISNFSEEVANIIQWCRKHKVPSILWNKEDPVHFSTFLPLAMVVDYVFTTDLDCIPKYKDEIGHDRVYLLPFAAQPKIHNPIEKYQRQDKFCFAGSYYLRYPQRQRDFASIIDTVNQFKGLDIYDRNFENPHSHYIFPDKYRKYILGCLPFEEIDKAYKGYNYGINMNTIKQSQSMFARRVYELLASNTVVISNFSRGVRTTFGDLVVCSDEPTQIYRQLEEICKDEVTFRKFRLLGLRNVMSEHTYSHRLDQLVTSLSGESRTIKTPKIAVISSAESPNERRLVLKSFEKQSHDNRILLVLDTKGEPDEFSEDDKNIIVFGSREQLISYLKSQEKSIEMFAVFSKEDFYAESYLTDLSLAKNYSDARVFGKVSYFLAEVPAEKDVHPIALQNQYSQYKTCTTLAARRSLSYLDERGLKWLTNNLKNINEAVFKFENMLALDEFSYCENGALVDPVKLNKSVGDLDVVDQGSPLLKDMISISNQLSARKPKVMEIDGVVRFDAPQITSFFTNPVTSKIELTLVDDHFVIDTKYNDDDFGYLYCNRTFTRDELNFELNSLFCYTASSTVSDICTVFEFLDQDLVKISHAMNRDIGGKHGLAIPEHCQFLRFGFRLQGKGLTKIESLVFGEQPEQPSVIVGNSKTLVLTKQYPAYDDLYKYGFLHSRVRAYRQNGLNVDIFRISNKSGLTYREFEGVDIAQGNAELLDKTLASGNYQHVLVHLLDQNMWSVLEKHIDKVKVTVWAHGSEIQLWQRREFEFEMMTETEIIRQKKLSEHRRLFWRSILLEPHSNLKIVFVSKYFRDEVYQDFDIKLPNHQVEIVHNYVDSNIFKYSKKGQEQRLKLLSIRPYSNRKYANDLTVNAILELSKRDFFCELDICIVGDGVLFEELTKPLSLFKNVVLIQSFMTHREIAQLHKDYGVFLTPTRMDAQGVSRDEAMSSGLVPITTNNTAIPEFVDESCGFLVADENYLEIADAVEQLYKNPDLFLTLSTAASNRVANTLNKTHTIRKEIQIIEAGICE